MRHLLNPLDFSVEEIGDLIRVADDIEKNPSKYAHVCDGKKLATCFYEPSTRTRLSFESAMLSLGGSVLGFASADSVPQLRARVLPILSVLFPATRISVQCVIPKKVPQWLPR